MLIHVFMQNSFWQEFKILEIIDCYPYVYNGIISWLQVIFKQITTCDSFKSTCNLFMFTCNLQSTVSLREDIYNETFINSKLHFYASQYGYVAYWPQYLAIQFNIQENILLLKNRNMHPCRQYTCTSGFYFIATDHRETSCSKNGPRQRFLWWGEVLPCITL